MRWMMGMAAAAMLAALGGCDKPAVEGYYDVPPDVAFARVAKADVGTYRKLRQCGMLIYFELQQQPPSTLTWIVTSSNVRVAQFGVRFTPQGSGTLVSIEVPKGPNGREIYDGTQHYAHPALMQPLRPSVRELIDAAIAQRPFDFDRVAKPWNTDQLCSEEYQTFQQTGQPYRMGDPEGIAPALADQWRREGKFLRVDRDEYFAAQ
jgi:hypothetical protein